MERVKVQNATAVGGIASVITPLGIPLPAIDASLLCEGLAPSIGTMIVGEKNSVYLTNTQPDIQFLIDKVAELAESVRLMTLLTVSRTPDTTPFDPAGTPTVELIIAELQAKVLI